MPEISIVMPVFNAEAYVAESIESVLKQSFDDFELIIVDDGSTDDTLSIIHSFEDNRIHLSQNCHDFIGSLNLGMETASGKYIVRMDADDIMYADRLKIQHTIMEEEQTIVVCATWVTPFGKDIIKGARSESVCGMLEQPLLYFLRRNILFHPTVMMRSAFLHGHSLKYEHYECAEDYKLWVEIAKLGGKFYVESQPLLYYRVSEDQVSRKKCEVQKQSALQIKEEILDHLLLLNSENYTSMIEMVKSMQHAREDNLLSDSEVFDFIYNVFRNNRDNLVAG